MQRLRPGSWCNVRQIAQLQERILNYEKRAIEYPRKETGCAAQWVFVHFPSLLALAEQHDYLVRTDIWGETGALSATEMQWAPGVRTLRTRRWVRF
jgi:hypothetical protein